MTGRRLFDESEPPQDIPADDWRAKIGRAEQTEIIHFCIHCARKTRWKASYNGPLYCLEHHAQDKKLLSFTDAEKEWAYDMARSLQSRAEREHRRDHFGKIIGNEMLAHVIGACGKIAVAKYFGLAFPKDYMERFRPAPDFGTRLSVRTTSSLFLPKLRVHPDDPADHVYILAVIFPRGASPSEGVRLHAWAWGHDVKKYTALSDPHNYGEPAHFAGMLMPFIKLDVDSIPKEIIAECAKPYKVGL